MFGYSRETYYRRKKNVKKRQNINVKVLELVQEKRNVMPRLGVRKLYYLLEEELIKIGVGRDKLFKILKLHNLLIKPKKQYHITTNSFHRFKKHKNLIEYLEIKRPEQVWVSDITYIGTRKDPMYLSLITDAYSKRIMGYNVSNSLATQGSIKALKMGIKQRIYHDKSLIHHSDRGVQYCSHIYQKLINKSKLICSMTESYDPYLNAVAERINGIMKQEFLGGLQIKNISLMKKIVRQSVNIYNELRPHWSSYMLTPNQMHLQDEVKMRTYKKNPSEFYKTQKDLTIFTI